MEQYLNYSGESGVQEFEIGPEFIILRFKQSPTRYLYDYLSAGRERVMEMVRLAELGRGLATYVTRNVRGKHARKY